MSSALILDKTPGGWSPVLAVTRGHRDTDLCSDLGFQTGLPLPSPSSSSWGRSCTHAMFISRSPLPGGRGAPATKHPASLALRARWCGTGHRCGAMQEPELISGYSRLHEQMDELGHLWRACRADLEGAF